MSGEPPASGTRGVNGAPDAPLPPGALAALVDLVVGGAVQDVRSAGPDLVALGVRTPGRTAWLALSALPGAAGPVLLHARPRRDREAGAAPFWERLRAAAEGCRVDAVVALPWKASATSPPSACLALRLSRGAATGALALVWDGRRRADLALAPPGEDETLVSLRPGRDAERLAVALARVVAGALPDPGVDRPSDREALRQLGDSVLARRAERLATARLGELRGTAARAARAARRLVAAREGDLARLGDPLPLRRAADALAAHLHEVRRGQAALSLEDWAAEGPLAVALDPALSPSENLRAAYRRASRARGGRERAEASLAEARARCEALEEVAGSVALLERDGAAGGAGGAALDAALDPLAEALRRLAPARPAAGRRPREAAALPPYHRHLSADGLAILVGRGARQNHELTFHVASGNDLWLHARDAAGPHVVVRLPRGAEVPQETLLDAATLAHVGSARGREPQGDVTWCRVKHVRPQPGGGPGRVTFAHDRTVRIRVETERVERLRRSRG